MKLEREHIQIAIQRVQSGELSPAEATELLLDDSRRIATCPTAPAANSESLAKLIARLGTPPDDVLDRWCERFESFTIAAEIAQRAFPPTELDGWYLTTGGDLMRLDQAAPNIDVGPFTSELRESARQHVAKFRRQFVERPTLAHREPEPVAVHVDVVEAPKPTPNPGPEHSPIAVDRARSDWRRTFLLRGLVMISVAAIGVMLWKSSQKSPPPLVEQRGPRAIEKGITHRSNSGATTTEPAVPKLQAGLANTSSDRLETFQPDSVETELSIPSASEWLSLDAVIPTTPSSPVRPQQLDSGSSPSTSPQSTTGTSHGESSPQPPIGDFETIPGSELPALAIGDGDDPLAPANDTVEPDESPQPTRQAHETAVRLPSTDDTEAIVLLAPFAISTPSLEFPIGVDVDLRRADADATWEIVDRKSSDTLAEIMVAANQSEFRWTDAAKTSSLANLICHGSLRDSAGPRIFLRSKVISDPYAMTFDTPDARPSWDLHSPLPPRVARVSADFDLPTTTKESEGIELGWIEPIDSMSPRRTRGLAVLRPIDGETVEVGVRFDLQCSRKLSARVRIFGRLDSSMPWQLISRPILENAANQITAQATRLSQKSTEMSAIYARANSEQRRDLSVYRDAIEEQSQKIAEVSKRIAELQSLINKIEQEVRVRMRVWIQWPESQQDLLVMQAASAL